MQIGVFAKTFKGDNPADVLHACNEAGFSAVQYNMSCSGLKSLPGLIMSETARAVYSAATHNDIQVSAVSATYNMTDPDAKRRQAGRAGFEAIASAATQMGTNLVTVCTGSLDPHDQWRYHPQNSDPETWIDMCREFEKILDHAEQHNVYIGVEPEHANVVNSSQAAKRLLKEFPGGRIRIVLDPANILEQIAPDMQHKVIDEALTLLGSEVALSHAKDRTSDGAVAPAGTGFIDWAYFLRGLAKIGFTGPVIAHGITPDQAPAVAQFLNRQLERL